MAGLSLDAQQDRAVLGGLRGLQPGRELARVERVDPRVRLGGGEQHRRVALAVPDAVIGRIRVEDRELVGVLGAAVFGNPEARDRELMVTQHVEQRHRAHGRAEQLRPLGHRRADQQPAVRSALDR